jgi:hypothetical protein
MSMARANMVLSFYDADHKLILPGNPVKFVSGSSEKPIYYGYINKVIHTMSTSGGCGTVVDMTYVRGTPDYMINGKSAISIGSRNRAYYG